MLSSLSCGLMSDSDSRGRFHFESVALAAGPHLTAGAASKEMSELSMAMREAFSLTALAMNYTIPCCAKQLNETYWEPSCFLNREEVKHYVDDPTSQIVHTFDSEADMDAYIQQDDYGWHDSVQTLAMGAVIDHQQTVKNQWNYILRSNSTEVPWSGQSLNTLQTGYDKDSFFMYYNNHVSSTKTAIKTTSNNNK